jgi:hypothetical protein
VPRQPKDAITTDRPIKTTDRRRGQVDLDHGPGSDDERRRRVEQLGLDGLAGCVVVDDDGGCFVEAQEHVETLGAKILRSRSSIREGPSASLLIVSSFGHVAGGEGATGDRPAVYVHVPTSMRSPSTIRDGGARNNTDRRGFGPLDNRQ